MRSVFCGHTLLVKGGYCLIGEPPRRFVIDLPCQGGWVGSVQCTGVGGLCTVFDWGGWVVYSVLGWVGCVQCTGVGGLCTVFDWGGWVVYSV